MVEVFALVRELLADDGVLWLNLGDSYSSGGRATRDTDDKLSARGMDTRPADGARPKNLLGIPWRVALALQADGWYVRSQVIWHKPNAMPESVTDRLTNDYEPLYLLAKSPRYYFDQAAIREPHKPESIKRAKYQLNIGQGGDAAVTGKRSGTWKNEQINHPDGRNRRAVWRISTEALRDEHYAPMPEALVEPCILAGSKPGDTVLDMFFGSGTVGRVALKYGRRCIGIDKNDSYISMSERRTDGVQVHIDALL
jgi:DNA modification methylase